VEAHVSLDLGKQVGPLPLGAWAVVVGTGVGIAWWQRRGGSATTTTDPEIVEDTGTTPGVGTGVNGGWVDVNPPTSSPTVAAPTTNEEWATVATNYLIAHNYPPASAQAAVSSYIGGEWTKISVTQFAMLNVVLAAIGSPPYPVTGDGPVPTAPVVTPYKYTTAVHKIAKMEGGRALVTRFSDPIAITGNNIESALKATVNDPRNLRYKKYYQQHGGAFPPGAIYVTVVKAK
jgi:hypothetical protein